MQRLYLIVEGQNIVGMVSLADGANYDPGSGRSILQLLPETNYPNLIPVRSSDPVSSDNGTIWYNSTTEKFRVQENGIFKDVINSTGVTGLYSGTVLAASFTGNPKTYAVTLPTPYATTAYSILALAVTDGTKSYSLSASSKTTTGFTLGLQSNSTTGLISVDWMTIEN